LEIGGGKGCEVELIERLGGGGSVDRWDGGVIELECVGWEFVLGFEGLVRMV